MRVVLEASDLIEVLSAHLGIPLNADQVSVRTEPDFEIEITGAVKVSDVKTKTSNPVPVEEEVGSGALVRAQVFRASSSEDGGGMSMKDILEYSRQIEGDIASYGRR